MTAYIVYESMFGNTAEVAEAVAAGVAGRLPVEVVEVGDAPMIRDLDTDLLIVGAPTHAFGLSRPQTRKQAADRAGHVVSDARSMRDWIDSRSVLSLSVATFDTHVHPPVPGSAARSMARFLTRRGCTLVAEPMTFRVNGTDGPVVYGELERATEWGASVARRVGLRPTPA
ncbi:flavodoxin [Occultella glacieicola]|uniref:Flavodoxin n=1 Tax=Occultella glacieicola TaxID=2518684 RepID=A0ABY2DZT3_9MICO|nr:flavodoxin domain-containing protein [Occultella glacieicola]TDE90394.1 flavodoxin [Occultella glacieicola]